MSNSLSLQAIETHLISSAIDNTEAVLTEIAKDVEEVTGLKAHFLLAGPEPQRDGQLVMFTLVILLISCQ